MEDLEDAASPVAAFVRDACDLGPTFTVTKEELFEAWRRWGFLWGYRPGVLDTFGRHLKAATKGSVQASRPRVGGTRVPHFEGIRVRSVFASLED